MEEETSVRTEPVFISIQDVIQYLHSGLTRKIGDNHYNAELGSVQEKYGLTPDEVNDLFRDPRLKNKKVLVPKVSRIVIIEDVPLSTISQVPVADTGVINALSDEEISEEYPTAQILEQTLTAGINADQEANAEAEDRLNTSSVETEPYF